MKQALHAMDPEFHAHGSDCGFFYTEGAFEPDVEPAAANPVLYVPRTVPGHHLPHFWLTADGETAARSTIDLPRLRHFVLIVYGGTDAWRDAVATSTHILARGLEVHVLPESATSPDHLKSWGELREVGPSGAPLVRPDGFVAWRWNEPPAEPRAALEAALAQISTTDQAARQDSASTPGHDHSVFTEPRQPADRTGAQS